MEILVSDLTYDHPERDRATFLAELEHELRQLSPEYGLSEADAGHGADWPVILATLGGLFLLGKPINENLEAWISLAKKLGAFVQRAKERWLAPRLDEDGAILIGLSRVLEIHDKPPRSVEHVGTVASWFQVFPLKDPSRLDHHPDALYVTSFRVDDEVIYVLGVKSKGTIEFEHQFSTSYLEF